MSIIDQSGNRGKEYINTLFDKKSSPWTNEMRFIGITEDQIMDGLLRILVKRFIGSKNGERV